MKLLLALATLFIAASNIFSLTFLYNALFKQRLDKTGHRICLAGIFCLLSMRLLWIPINSQHVRILVFLVGDLFILCLYQGNLAARCCIAVLHFAIAGALETILLPISMIIAGVSFSQLHQSLLLVAVNHFIPTFIILLHCILLSRLLRKWKSSIELPVWESATVFLFAVFTIFELYFTAKMIEEDSPMIPLVPVLGFVLLFMNLALLLLLEKLASRYKIKQENLALLEQMRYERQRLQAAAESYEAQRSLTHDFDNRLLTMIQLLKNGQTEEALTYAQTVKCQITKTDVAVSTNNPIADAILNQKYRQAQEAGVGIQFMVNDLSGFPLSADEMVTVLSNLLDNALEACGRYKAVRNHPMNGSIRVKLLMEPALATMSVQNTSVPVTISAEYEIETTKKNCSEHGFGLRNCKKILKHSGFDYAVRYQDGWFQFTAVKAL